MADGMLAGVERVGDERIIPCPGLWEDREEILALLCVTTFQVLEECLFIYLFIYSLHFYTAEYQKLPGWFAKI